ncbi:MAG: methyl-accepting chemotaxis protein [Epulopiscium sp.]|nr:methyl-accepting chemotaxis protein [Candidatus Epulonipiscium sp.]
MAKSIKSKLVLIMLLIVLVPFLVLNLSNYYLISKGYQKTIESHHLTFAKSLSANVSSYMTNYYKLTEEIANNKEVKSFNIAAQKTILGDSAKRNPDIDLYYIQGTNGKQTAKSSGELGDRSERWWFKKIIQDRQPFISESYFSVTGNIPVTSIFIPLYNQQDQFIGVMGTDLKLDALQRIVEDLSSKEGIIAYVIDSKGVVIAHPDKVQVLEQYNYVHSQKNVLQRDEKGTVVLDINGNQKIISEDIHIPKELQEATEKCLDGEIGYIEYTNLDGDKIVSAYTPVSLPGESEAWGILTVQNKKDAFAFVSNIINANLLLAIGLIGIIILLSFMLAKQVTTPLNILNKAFDKAAAGDLTVQAIIKAKDEFGQAGENFNHMLDNIGSLVEDVREAGNTVLTNSGSLAKITEQTSIANSEVAQAVEEIAKGAIDQAHNTELGATKINELADMIEKVKGSINQIKSVSSETNELSSKGMKVMSLLKDSSKDNVVTAQKLNNVIEEMDKSSTEIGDITNTISQIADQTNLLALNAAIEAARVGEAGKGFTVVADEIRKLAEESSDSASNIKYLIDRIQEQSKEAVHAVKETERVVEKQNIQVEETEDIFQNIAKSIIKLNQEIIEINHRTENIAKNKDEIIVMIENLSALSEETSAATEEVSASVEEQLASMEEINSYVKDLEELSESLTESISKLTR